MSISINPFIVSGKIPEAFFCDRIEESPSGPYPKAFPKKTGGIELLMSNLTKCQTLREH